jgi:integrase
MEWGDTMTPMKIDLDYLVEERTRHGAMVVYVRRPAGKGLPGKRLRILAPVGTPAFFEQYRAAVKALFDPALVPPPAPNSKAAAQQARPKPNTLGWLIDRYLAESTDFATMARIGRARRDRILTDLKTRLGSKPMMMPADRIEAGLSKRSAQPGAANEWLKSIKALYSWAVKVRLMKENPATGISKIRVVTDGHHTWSLDEIAAWVRRHPPGTMAYLALMVLLFTGLRREDATRFGRQHVREGIVRFRTGKTGAELVTSLAWPLEDAIATSPESGELAYLLSGKGRPFASGAAFGNWFKDRAVEAGIGHCTPHGVRKAATTIADEEGASEDTLNAMFTWVNPNQSATYTRKASRIKLAAAGFDLIATRLESTGIIARNANRLVAPQSKVRVGATKTGG